MNRSKDKLELQLKSWSKLRRLHPSPIDLEKIRLIRQLEPDSLLDPDDLAELILDLGLTDDGLEDFPVSLRSRCGHGLMIWQYPQEFAMYLSQILRLGPRSYIELGTRHGGSFIATVECMQRRGPIDAALAVDIMPCPSMSQYTQINSRAEFEQVNTQSDRFEEILDSRGPFDVGFIDANHDEDECRREFELLNPRCAMVALHDIVNPHFPAAGHIWEDIKNGGDHECTEHVSRFDEPHTPMGIGLAIRR